MLGLSKRHPAFKRQGLFEAACGQGGEPFGVYGLDYGFGPTWLVTKENQLLVYLGKVNLNAQRHKLLGKRQAFLLVECQLPAKKREEFLQ